MAALPAFGSTVINFDDLNAAGGAIALTNQYAGSGVLFDQITAAQNFKSNILPPSTPNYASPFWSNLNPGTLTFVSPSNSLNPAFATTVTITMVGLTSPPAGNYSGATVDALDLSGTVIAGQTQVINPITNVTSPNYDLTFTGEVHALRFTHNDTTSGALPFDNLTFGPLSSVPEPATLPIAGSAILVLVMLGTLRHNRGRHESTSEKPFREGLMAGGSAQARTRN